MHKKSVYKVIVAIVVALAFVLPSSAAFANIGITPNSDITMVESKMPEGPLGTVYVDDDRPPDWYDATHVKTIQEGITNASSGDTVFVYNGLYYGKVTTSKSVSLTGESKENTIIDGQGQDTEVVKMSSGTSISGFTVRSGKYGIYMTMGTSGVTIMNCIIHNTTSRGIYFLRSTSSSVTACEVYDTGVAIFAFLQAKNIEITNCDVHNNANGITLLASSLCVLTDNIMWDNEVNLIVEDGYNHDISPSNTVNGRPVYYLYSQSNLELNETHNVGFLALLQCTNITVTWGDTCGVVIVGTTDSTISNVSVHNSRTGIILQDSSNIDIIDCDVYTMNQAGVNSDGCSNINYVNINAWDCGTHGFTIWDETDTTITNCNVWNCGWFGIYINNGENIDLLNSNAYDNGQDRPEGGIYFDARYSNIINCTAYNNDEVGIYAQWAWTQETENNYINCTIYNNTRYGLYLNEISDSTITGCTIYDNGWGNDGFGMYVASMTKENLIHHNNFIDNNNSVYAFQENYWDNGSEGNYWSDYTGLDEDENGIGDTPYNITGCSYKDMYPLMVPIDEVSPVITDVLATPELQTTYEPVNITCTVTDNWNKVDTVKVNVTGPEGFTLEATMNEGSYWYEAIYPTIGVYYYFIWTSDTSGNPAVSDTYSFAISDIVTPVSSVDSLPTWKNTAPFGITATAYDDIGVENVTLYYRYSNESMWTWTEWTSYGTDEEAPWSWSFTGNDGYYEFYSIATDGYNVELPPDPLVADASTGLDTVLPVTTITLVGTIGENDWYTSPVDVTLSATDTLSGIASRWYKLDGGYWTLYTTTFTVSDDGEHTVEYYSFDSAGNQEATKTEGFKIDKTLPATEHELEGFIGEDGWYVTNVTVILTAEDETSGLNYTTYKIDNGDWETYSVPFIITEAGNHILYYYSVDLAGNTEPTSDVDIKIDHDTLPPVTTHEFDGVEGDNGWFVSDVTVTLGALDLSSPSGVNYTMYKLDDGEWTEYVEQFYVTEDDVYTLYYYSVDYLGNEEDVNEAELKIDQTAPTIELDAEELSPGKWLLIATVSDTTSGIAKVEFYLAGEFIDEVTEPPYILEVSGKGPAQAIVFDNAGHNTVSSSVEISQSQSQSQSSSPSVTLRMFSRLFGI